VNRELGSVDHAWVQILKERQQAFRMMVETMLEIHPLARPLMAGHAHIESETGLE